MEVERPAGVDEATWSALTGEERAEALEAQREAEREQGGWATVGRKGKASKQQAQQVQAQQTTTAMARPTWASPTEAEANPARQAEPPQERKRTAQDDLAQWARFAGVELPRARVDKAAAEAQRSGKTASRAARDAYLTAEKMAEYAQIAKDRENRLNMTLSASASLRASSEQWHGHTPAAPHGVFVDEAGQDEDVDEDEGEAAPSEPASASEETTTTTPLPASGNFRDTFATGLRLADSTKPGDVESALAHLARAVELADAARNPAWAVSARAALGSLDLKVGQVRQAIAHLRVALDACFAAGLSGDQADAVARLLQMAYLDVGDHKSAAAVQQRRHVQLGTAPAPEPTERKADVSDPLPPALQAGMANAMRASRTDASLETLRTMVATFGHGRFPGVVNYADEAGVTPVMVAAGRGDAAFVLELSELGANVSAKDKAGQSALVYAAKFGGVPCVLMLLDAGAAFDADDLAPEEVAKWRPGVIEALHARARGEV